MDSNSKAILGFLVGITAGAVAGLLLAPSSGEETRRKITDRAKGYKDELNSQITSALGKLSNYADSIRGTAADVQQTAESNVG